MKQPKSFEEGMERLQSLLGQLQDESTPLADSVKLYAEAAGLIHYCNTALDKAKLQVEEIDASLTPNAEVSHEAWGIQGAVLCLDAADRAAPDGIV